MLQHWRVRIVFLVRTACHTLEASTYSAISGQKINKAKHKITGTRSRSQSIDFLYRSQRSIDFLYQAQRSIDFAHQKKKYRLLCCINANDRAIFPKEASIDFLYRAQKSIDFISSLVPRPGYFSVGVAWGRGYVIS